ncbi:hypothetical protein Tco_1128038, partial [Tanacetum coccineum]
TGLKVQEEAHHDLRPTLQWLPFYCTPTTSSNVVIPVPTLKDLIAATPNSKVLAKVEYSKNNDEESEDDNDAYYEIPIITPIHSLATIAVGGN